MSRSAAETPRVRGTVVAVGDVLPEKFAKLLAERGLAVHRAPIAALANPEAAVGAAFRDAESSGPSFVALIAPSEALPEGRDDAVALFRRVEKAGAALVIVGAPREELVDLTEDDAFAPQAWISPPISIPALVTAVRSALTALSMRAELEAARRLAALKDAEARSLFEVGTALSAERDIARLQNLILQRCREMTVADAGSLYLVDEDQDKQPILRFEIAQNDSITASYQRSTMPLTDRSIAGYAALTGETLNIADVYHLPDDAPYGFNRAFDERMGYRTKSMLAVPMRNHEGDIIGVIQLINHKPSLDVKLSSAEVAEREVTPFPHQAEEVLDAFAGQAAVALNNQLLIQNIERLFEGFVRASVTAIEARDPTTSGHSERVAELTVGIAQAVSDIGVGRWREAHFTDEQIREIRYAGLLHDFGKIGVREHVLVKAKKLFDPQLEVIRLRFGYVRKALEAEHNRRQLAIALERDRAAFLAAIGPLDADYRRRIQQLDEDLATIVAANEPTVLAQEAVGQLEEIATRTYMDVEGNERPMLEEPELLALSVRRGSLTEEERVEIESHVSHTYRFLSLMPWTRQLKQLPLIAGAHHEKLDGSGYPNGLKENEIPLQSRMMTIADIYDALTAADRPYKRAVPVDKALDILSQEAQANHIDSELLDIFIQKRIFDIAVTVTMRQAQQALGLAASRA
ncbi:MAG TPA: HD domain-containing phosphohydrolase [Chloroflexota bacterium]|nr:HD domain-containing phosphohydrolase [Chloroflexota bacterium]